jgi:Protein of unknown function (DUF1214)
MTFVNGSGQPINTIFPDAPPTSSSISQPSSPGNARLPPAGFRPVPAGRHRRREADALRSRRRGAGAAGTGGADRLGHGADAELASTDPARLVYPDRKWEWLFIGNSATWDTQGFVNTDRRAGFSYQAIGMSSAMVEKVVGQGSQYLGTPRDATGAPLDGAKTYLLRLPRDIPVANFWSVVVYDAESRSMLRNGQPFPSLSQFTGPEINPDGSVDLYFGPEAPAGKEFVTEMPRIENGCVLPMDGPGLGAELLPAVFERPDLTSRHSTP